MNPIQDGIHSVSIFSLSRFKYEYPRMQQNTAMINIQFLKWYVLSLILFRKSPTIKAKENNNINVTIDAMAASSIEVMLPILKLVVGKT